MHNHINSHPPNPNLNLDHKHNFLPLTDKHTKVFSNINTKMYIPVNGSYVPCAEESCYYKKYLEKMYSQGKTYSNVKVIS